MRTCTRGLFGRALNEGRSVRIFGRAGRSAPARREQ